MFGQGSPVLERCDSKTKRLFAQDVRLSSAMRHPCAPSVRRHPGLLFFFPIIVCLLFLASTSGTSLAYQRTNLSSVEQGPATLEMRIRIAWSSIDAEQWSGDIRLKGGTFSSPATLGFEPESAGALVVEDSTITLQPSAAAKYGGIELNISCRRDAELLLRMKTETNQTSLWRVPVLDLVGEPLTQTFNGNQNRITVSRAPGDTLAVVMEQSDLVFKTGDQMRLSVTPRLTNLNSQDAKLVVRMESNENVPATLWTSNRDLAIDDMGNGPSNEWSVPLPQREGVYRLVFELQPKRYQSPFGQRKRNNLQRSIQFVVLSPEAEPMESTPWNSVAELSPAITRDSGRDLRNAFNLNRNPFVDRGNQLRSEVNIGGRDWVQLEVGGWHAVPILFEKIGQPHRIKIQFDDSSPMAMGISLLEPNSRQQVTSFGFDSGIQIPESKVNLNTSSDSQTAVHEMVVWPRSHQSYLLFANRDRARTARIGSVTVQAGPEKLSTKREVRKGARQSRREYLAFVESPFFPESVGAEKQVDPNLQESLDDWETFYVGTDRLVQHLIAQGCDGAMIKVAGDGSTLFPSELLRPNPKFDTGVFFSNGQDPVRKDVLKMMLIMFQRAGLKLVPIVDFSSPLPELERLKLISEQDDRLRLVNFRGEPRSETQLDLPRYNPLNAQLQRSVARVMDEIQTRYSDYAAFGGIVLDCHPGSFMALPGREWGYDQLTVDQFLASESVTRGELPQGQALNDQLLGEMQPRWLEWRTQQMSRWYIQLAKTMNQNRPGTRLYLAATDLYRNHEVGAALSPTLHQSTDFASVLTLLGIDPAIQTANENITLLTPHRIAPTARLASRRVGQHLDDSKKAQEFFRAGRPSSELFRHESVWAHFEEFQQMAPWGQQQIALMRHQPLTPVGPWNRVRFSRAVKLSDARQIIDGGWSLLQGQDESTSQMIQVYRSLPNQAFVDVPCEQAVPFIRPIAVRQVTVEGQMYFYAVNSSPWPIEVSMLGSISDVSQVDWIVERPENIRVTGQTKAKRIQFKLPPYSLVAGRVENASTRLSEYRYSFPETAALALRTQLQALQTKLTKANQIEDVLLVENASFSQDGTPSLSSWTIGDQPSSNIDVDSSTGKSDSSSLRMSFSQQPVWSRSAEFRSPATGRLSVSVWLKTDKPAVQPQLRLAIEGRNGKRSYYRYGVVGAGDANAGKKIGAEWQRFAVHFDDLPIEGMDKLRIGFDLMGPGNVWIDDVKTYDRWLDDNDTRAMTQLLAGAGRMLNDRDALEGCRLILEGYWPRFLDEHIAEDPPALDDITGGRVLPAKTQIRSSRIRRFRNLNPRKPFPFR